MSISNASTLDLSAIASSLLSTSPPRWGTFVKGLICWNKFHAPPAHRTAMCVQARNQMTLIPTNMLAIQAAIDGYENKLPRRRSPSAEQAWAWQASRSRGWKRLLFWHRMITVKQIRTAFRARTTTARIECQIYGATGLNRGGGSRT